MHNTQLSFWFVEVDALPTKSKEEIQQQIEEVLDQDLDLAKEIIRYAKFVLSFTFVLVIIGSWRFVNTYLDDIEFENYYVEQVFVQLDERRKCKLYKHI